jgi:GTP pyrophosphokinase
VTFDSPTAADPLIAAPAMLPEMAEVLERTAPEGQELVRRAFETARRLHEGQARDDGSPYITHPVAVAALLTDLRLDHFTVAAGLLHDTLEDCGISLRDLEKEFPHDVVRIVDGVTKINKINFTSKTEAQRENLRKLFLAMAQDVRVVLVKLCDRLHNIRTLKSLPPERQIPIARETLEIFAQIAGRLGMYRVKVEFEDTAFRVLNPDAYRAIQNEISQKRGEREKLIGETVRVLKERLEPMFPGIEVYGRYKHFYSIWKKMHTDGLHFDEIYDLNAVRVVCERTEQCYGILGVIHSFWRPIPGRIKDMIATPKANGYQSLHTTVMGINGDVTEVQIRTREMHERAEYGVAAHWRYKEAQQPEHRAPGGEMRQDLTWVRELIEGLAAEKEAGTALEHLKKDIIDDCVLCFTPRGDVIELPVGATAVDFAYMVHTEVGNHCVGAKINKRLANLRTKLQNGDVVEVLTRPDGHPSRDWLKFVVTSRARNKVRSWLKSREAAIWVESGRKEVERWLSQHHVEIPKGQWEAGLERVAKELTFLSLDDLLAEIGFGGVHVSSIMTRLYPEHVTRQVRKVGSKPRKGQPVRAVVEGFEEGGTELRIAACCHPVPGEDIVGFVTRGRGITVHRRSCPTISRIGHNAAEGQRVLRAWWEGDIDSFRNVPVRIETEDRTGMLNEITREFSRLSVFIEQCTTKSYRGSSTAVINIICNIAEVSQLDTLMATLREIPGVLSVERTSRAV